MVWKLGHFGNYTRNTWKALKYGGGKPWRESRKKGISYIQYEEGRITGLVISCAGTAS
jgi:hypothetical protein